MRAAEMGMHLRCPLSGAPGPLPSGSLILLPAADLRSTLLPELKRLVSSSRGLPSALQFGGL